jgi:hypothetical protein
MSEALRKPFRGPDIWLLLLLVMVNAYFFPRWADWNQNSRFNLVMAIVDDRTLQIDRYVDNTGDYAYYQGHYYSDKAPGMALLGVPVYAVFKTLFPRDSVVSDIQKRGLTTALEGTAREGRAGMDAEKLYFFIALAVTALVTVAIPSAILGLLLFRMAIAFGCSYRESLVGTMLYCLGTSAFPYSNAFTGHQLSALLLLAAFAASYAIRRRKLSHSWLLLVGFLLGYAAITEYPTVLAGILIASYAVWGLSSIPRAAVALAAGALPSLAALAIYDYLAFGTIMPVGYFHSTLWTDVHSTGFVSLTYPRLEALWGLTFGIHRGLFFLSPFLLFAVAGYGVLWRKRAMRLEFWLLLMVPMLTLLFYSSSAMWQGGFAVGPRYLLPALPFLALAAAVGLGHVWRHLVLLRPLAAAAGVWSIFAVWAESIGGQSFPDYSSNPLFDLSLPRLAEGDIARNAGMVLDLSGWASIAPIVLFLIVAFVLLDSRQAESAELETLRLLEVRGER